MPIFNYQARTKKGNIQTGRVEASSSQSASEILQRNNLIVVALEPVSEAPIYARKIALFERVGKKDVVILSRQLATLVQAEVPLVTALRTVASQTQNNALKTILAAISADVDGGTSFSVAIGRHPKVFSAFYAHMVRAGEATGKLSTVLDYLAEHEERQYHIVSKIRGAMVYPIIVFVAFFVVALLMLVFVVPQLTTILESAGQTLPLLTRIIIGTSDFVSEFWYIVILGVVGLPIFFWRYIKTESGQRLWDIVQLRLPIIGGVYKKIYLFRFADSLSSLVQGGVPIAEALGITSDIVGNREYQKVIMDAQAHVRRGETIGAAFRLYPEIPPLVTQMITIGEQTGKLDSILKNVGAFYQKEVDTTLDNVTSLLEPVLLLFLGIGVGILVLGVLMPIYNLTSSV